MRKRFIIAAVWFSVLLLAACGDGSQYGSGGNSADTSLGAITAEDIALDEPSRSGETGNSSHTSGPVYKVVIDPGHGGEDSGATSVTGRYEKEFTLSLSLAIAAKLAEDPQLQIELTRTDDAFISTREQFRPEFANNLQADLFISIHGNTFEDASASGTESFYYHEESLAFAGIIHKHVVQATGFKDRGVKYENFYVLRDTEMPSVLLELGYLTNPANEASMWTYSFQDAVAAAIGDGIREYLQLYGGDNVYISE
jgi:N-acetylmuramoyl-L-alanine amidase